ncbi:hypothetical protein ACSBR1_032547 [Camellia fascicularis]
MAKDIKLLTKFVLRKQDSEDWRCSYTSQGVIIEDCVSTAKSTAVIPLADFDSAEVSSISKALSGASVIDLKITTTKEDLIVVLPSGKAVTDLLPQFDEIQRRPGRAVIISGPAPPGSGFDFFSHVFSPKMGINEASSRGGILNLHLDGKTQRVLLRGKAITVMEGSLLV